VPEIRHRHFLPALLGSLRQQQAEGELVLEQNDGIRRLYWADGDLRYLRSDAVGEQFGNFLIRRGVLDMASLKELLSDGEGARVGDRVVQWGLMTKQERDERLHELLGSVLLHAMEHTIIKMTWIPGPLDDNLSGDLQFHLDHRWLVWDAFQNAKIDRELVDMFHSEPDWRWQAQPNLLEALSSLPLTPTLAYALSLLGTEPLGCETIGALTGFPQPQAAQLVATLWALGGLSLVQGELPLPPKAAPPAPSVIPAPDLELEITLADEEILDSPKSLESPHPMTQMDILEMDYEPRSGEPLLLLEPPSMGDPFSSPAPAEGSYLSHEQDSPTPTSLPSSSGEDAFPPAERARRLVVKAKSYLVQERTSEAIRALEQAIKLEGDSAGAYESWLLLGRLRVSNPAWSTRAIEALQVASRLNPRAAEPWALMGELYHRKGFKANAQGCFRRALELDPSVAVPAGWSHEDSIQRPPKENQSGLMDKLRGMFGREKG
jgi:tetratricopeptide (TPR) repeat protein